MSQNDTMCNNDNKMCRFETILNKIGVINMKISEESLTQNLADNIQYYRKVSKLTQAQLGKLLNVSRTSISYWEQGLRTPKIEDLVKLSCIFKISVDHLINRPEQDCFYRTRDMGLSAKAVAKLISNQDTRFFDDALFGEEGAMHLDTFYAEHMASTISHVIESDRLVNLLSDYFYVDRIHSITNHETDLPQRLEKYFACIETGGGHFIDIDIQQFLQLEIIKELGNIKREIDYGKSKSGKKQGRKNS